LDCHVIFSSLVLLLVVSLPMDEAGKLETFCSVVYVSLRCDGSGEEQYTSPLAAVRGIIHRHWML
jgi:hypothetical protein